MELMKLLIPFPSLRSSVPFTNNPQNAVETKNIDETLIEKWVDQSSKDWALKRARPREEGVERFGSEGVGLGEEKKGVTGPTWPAL